MYKYNKLNPCSQLYNILSTMLGIMYKWQMCVKESLRNALSVHFLTDRAKKAPCYHQQLLDRSGPNRCFFGFI
jgi:hypothetical protein